MPPSELVTPPSDLTQDSLATYEKLVKPASESDTLGPVSLQTHTMRVSIGLTESSEESSSPTMAAPDGAAPPNTENAPIAPAYHLVGVIGRGGMGEVWQAVQYSLGRTVAVKRLKSRRDDTMPDVMNAAVRSFREEAFFSAQLEHPNIVPIHDLGVDEDGSPLLAMKLIEGSEWSDVIKAEFPAHPPEEFLSKHIPILMSVAQAVAFAHSKGIVHRDLKPQQVMLGGFGEVLLADWGLAIKVDGSELPETPIPLALPVRLPGPDTASSPSGTPAFMAPEQTLSTARGVGTWTDVFLLGGTLYLLLTGVPPHEGTSAQAVFLRANEGKIRTPSERVAGSRTIPPELEALCLSCLKHEPRERLGSAMEFVEGLKDYLTGAGRRRESIAIIGQMTATLSRQGLDYRVYSEVLSKIDHARALWADNPDIADLRGRALEGHARLALSGGDLRLARLQAEAMRTENPNRAGVLREIDAAEARVLAQTRQRRMAVAAVVVLLAALLVSAVIFTQKVSAQRDIAEKRRAEAEAAKQLALERELQVRQARSDSEDMLDFVIGDLRESLMELDRIDLLNDAAERALAHYKRQPFETLTSDERLKVVGGLVKIAEIFKDQSRFDLSIEAIKEGLSWIERANSIDPATKPNPEWGATEIGLRVLWNDLINRMQGGNEGSADADQLVELAKEYERIGHIGPLETASTYFTSARCLERTARYPEALERINQGMSVLENGLRSGKIVEEKSIFVRRSLVSKRALIEFGLSDYEACEASALETVKIAEHIIENNPEKSSGFADLADAYGLLSTVHSIRGHSEEAIQFAERAVDARKTALSSAPLDRSSRSNLALAYLILTRRLAMAGKYEQALEVSNPGIEIGERLLAENTQDTIVLGNTSSAYGTRSEVHMGLRDPESAIADMRRSAEIASMAAEIQPDAPLNVMNLSAVRTTLANALMGANRNEEALSELIQAVEILKAGIEKDPKNVELWRRKAESLAFLSLAYGKLSRDKESQPPLSEAIELLDQYLAEKPGTDGVLRLKRSLDTSYRNVLLKLGKKKEALDLARGSAEEAYQVYLKEPGYHLYFVTYLNAATTEWSAFDFAGEGGKARDIVRDAALRLRDYRKEYPERDLNDYRFRAEQLWARTECYDLGDLQAAKDIALYSYNDMKDSGFRPNGYMTRSDALNLLYLLGYIEGQERHHEAAMRYLDEAVDLSDSLLAEAQEKNPNVSDVAAWNDFVFSRAIRAGYLGVAGHSTSAAAEYRDALDALDKADAAAPVGRVVFLRTRIDIYTSMLGALDTASLAESFPNLRDDITSTMLVIDSADEFDARARNDLRQRIIRGFLPHQRMMGDYAGILEATSELPRMEEFVGEESTSKPSTGLRHYLERYLALKATGKTAEATELEKDVRTLYDAERARDSRRDFDVLILSQTALALGDAETAERDFRGAMTRVTRTREMFEFGASQGWLSPEDMEYFKVGEGASQK